MRRALAYWLGEAADCSAASNAGRKIRAPPWTARELEERIVAPVEAVEIKITVRYCRPGRRRIGTPRVTRLVLDAATMS